MEQVGKRMIKLFINLEYTKRITFTFSDLCSDLCQTSKIECCVKIA